jgi:hypothetical protein
MRIRLMFTLVLLAAGVAPLSMAYGGSYARDQVSTCTEINCEAQIIQGYLQPGEPFIAQVYAAAGECLRLEVIAQTVDSQMQVIDPNANLNYPDRYRPGDNRPLVIFPKIFVVTGYYTTVIGGEYYVPPGGSTITLSYGRYANPDTNPNCK